MRCRKQTGFAVSIVNMDMEIESDVNYRIKVSWFKWRDAYCILRDGLIRTNLKVDFYRITILQSSYAKQRVGQLRNNT